MIIEILSSFLINDENGTGMVDIEKMKKLFPFTMNIQDYHLRRFIHCNIHVLNQVMEKVKIRKSNFIQYQLLNRIMSSVQRLDKDIDRELFKIQRMREISLNVEKKNENKFESENEEFKKNRDKSSDINNATYTSIESLVNNTNIQKRKDLILMKDYNKVLKEMRKGIIKVLLKLVEQIIKDEHNFTESMYKIETLFKKFINKSNNISFPIN